GGRRRSRRPAFPRRPGGRSAPGTIATEIGDVPAGTLKLESSRGHLLGKRALAAFAANRKGRIGNLLQNVFGMAAGAALIGVDGHQGLPGARPENKKPSVARQMQSGATGGQGRKKIRESLEF